MHTILFILLSIFSHQTFHETADPGPEILEASYKQIFDSPGFTTDFSYFIVDPNQYPSRGMEISGEIRFSQGRYAVITPYEEIYCDLSQQWIFNPQENVFQEFRYEPDYDLTLEIIYQLFRNQHLAQYQGLEAIADKKYRKIRLPIQDSRLDHIKASVWVDPDTSFIAKIVLIDHRQVTTTYRFRNIQTELEFLDEDFIFDLDDHPGAKKF